MRRLGFGRDWRQHLYGVSWSPAARYPDTHEAYAPWQITFGFGPFWVQWCGLDGYQREDKADD